MPEEPNDTIFTATATGITFDNPGIFTSADSIGDNPNVAPELDVDFFQVQLDTGARLTIDIDAAEFGSSLDSVLRLFNSTGNQLALSNDDLAPGEFFSSDSFIDFTASSSDTYYIGVSGYDNTFYDPFIEGSGFNFFASTGNYNIEIAVTPPVELIGTADDDILTGTDGSDIISGLEGDDFLEALDGNDQIFGGEGDDFINAGEGNDSADGGAGDDDLFGDSGDDTITGGDGLDVILGGDGSDQIDGGFGKDRLFGEFGDDTLSGEEGNDLIKGGDGFDSIFGGVGKDRLFGEFGEDALFGEDGNDQLTGGDGSDSLNGGDGNDRLVGINPQSQFSSFEVDTLIGGLGRDTFVLGDKARVYYNDGAPFSNGEFDYALIADFNTSEDFIQLQGSADLYSFDFFTSSLGTIDAAIIYDPGVTARGEVIAIIQAASLDLNISNSAFIFV